MPFSFAPFATVAEEEIADKTVSLLDAAVYSGLGIGIVFLVLVILMVFIAIMSAALKNSSDKPKVTSASKAEKVEKNVAVTSTVKPVATTPTAVPDGAMFVTLDGKKHTVTVVEKIPQFTVKLNGKTHSVDVEPVQEGEE